MVLQYNVDVLTTSPDSTATNEAPEIADFKAFARARARGPPGAARPGVAPPLRKPPNDGHRTGRRTGVARPAPPGVGASRVKMDEDPTSKEYLRLISVTAEKVDSKLNFFQERNFATRLSDKIREIRQAAMTGHVEGIMTAIDRLCFITGRTSVVRDHSSAAAKLYNVLEELQFYERNLEHVVSDAPEAYGEMGLAGRAWLCVRGVLGPCVGWCINLAPRGRRPRYSRSPSLAVDI